MAAGLVELCRLHLSALHTEPAILVIAGSCQNMLQLAYEAAGVTQLVCGRSCCKQPQDSLYMFR